MRVLTVATHQEGYLGLLKDSSRRWDYQLEVLGWGQEWQGLDWKLDLYCEALHGVDPEEVLMCVDAFDVVLVGPAEEARRKFCALGVPFLCSGQRRFAEWAWMERLADKVMTDDPDFDPDQYPSIESPYKRPCTGMMMGRGGHLLQLFQRLRSRESRRVHNDQILMTRFYLDHPEAVALDGRCAVFQNLWKSRGMLWGSASAKDEKSEVRLGQVDGQSRLRNVWSGETPCVLHGPRNLDLKPILTELGYEAPGVAPKHRLHYLRYSVLHYVTRLLFHVAPRWVGSPRG